MSGREHNLFQPQALPALDTECPMAIIVDDDELMHPILQAMLKRIGMQSECFASPIHGLERITRSVPDMVILDYDMPEQSGMYLLKALKNQSRTIDIPVVLMTGSADEAVLSESFANGADDFIRKPLNKTEFQARITSVMRQSILRKQMQHSAYYDGLTGLAKRNLLLQRIETAIKAATETSYRQFAVFYLDFDRFKFINDSLGHEAGDLLLIQIAERLNTYFQTLQENTPFEHTVARVGGDEFVVLLSDSASLDYASDVAEELLALLGEPYQLNRDWVITSASIGVYQYQGCYHDPEQILRNADTAMYEAKGLGKGCTQVFNQALENQLHERVQLEEDLAMSIGSKRLYLTYQPIISLEDGTRQSVEALVRWQHPSRGLLTPGKFIPIAENSRLMMPLTEQVFELASSHFIEWYRKDRVNCPKFVSINLSQMILTQTGAIDILEKILIHAGMRPDEVQLEISQNELIHHEGIVLDKLRQLHRRGYRIALDDFGKGYSSLSCLELFPFDLVKLNKEFIFKLDQSDRKSIAHTKCILEMARVLKIPCAAVGVERASQIAVLQDLGCEYGQGNYLSLPVPNQKLLHAPWTSILGQRTITDVSLAAKLSAKCA